MASVVVTGVKLLENPAKFEQPFQFEVMFECLTPLPDDLEWTLTYVGSPDSTQHDQLLDSVLIGPVSVGLNKFVFEATAPDIQKLPKHEWIGTTVVLLQCAYRDQVFFRVGYFVMNEYTGGQLVEAPESIAAREEKIRKLTVEATQKIASGELAIDDDDDELEIAIAEGEEKDDDEENEEGEEGEEGEENPEDEMGDLLADEDDIDELSDSDVEGEEEEEEEEEEDEEDDTPGKRPPAGKGLPGGKHPPAGGKQPPGSSNGTPPVAAEAQNNLASTEESSAAPSATPSTSDSKQTTEEQSTANEEAKSEQNGEADAAASSANPKKRARAESKTEPNGDGAAAEGQEKNTANGENGEEMEKQEPPKKKRALMLADPEKVREYLINKYLSMHLDDGGARWYLNVDPHLIQRNVLMDQPRVTLFTIQW